MIDAEASLIFQKRELGGLSFQLFLYSIKINDGLRLSGRVFSGAATVPQQPFEPDT